MIPTHIPVMADEVMEYLAPPQPNAFMIDGTLGEGGHTARYLALYPETQVVGIDADESMAKRAAERLSPWAAQFRVEIGWTDEVLAKWASSSPDIILMDLGISSFHYQGSGRGFSLNADEPLDMRLGSQEARDASQMVNTMSEVDLANLIYRFGEERYSRRIAHRIVEERRRKPITRASLLADIVSKAVPASARRGRIHAATRTFQALRIAVNDELGRLSRLLKLAPAMLAPNGRLGIISFHSLEDRLVKQAYRALDRRYGGNYEVITRKPLVPTEQECRDNPSSRSAKFRVLRKPRPQEQL